MDSVSSLPRYGPTNGYHRNPQNEAQQNFNLPKQNNSMASIFTSSATHFPYTVMECEVTKKCEELPSSNDYSIFPPTNHENIYISNHTHQTQSSLSQCSSSSLSSSPFDETEYDPDSFSPSDENETTGDDDNDIESTIFKDTNSRIVLLPNDLSRWFSIGVEVLCSRAVGIVSWFRNYGDVGRTVWSFGSLAGVVTAVIALAVYRSYRRRCLREGRINQLMILLNQKDERIIQLLQQIAKMNEILVARHSVS